jgi:hypothetical protein
MKMKSRAAATALAVAALGGIGVVSMQPAYAARTAAMMTVTDEPLPAGATMKQVEAAVLQSLSSRSWTIKNRSPGSVDAQYGRTDSRSSFTVDITVTYTASSFSVVYKDSTGLSYDAQKGKIHANYNRWINNLKVDIVRNVNNAIQGAPAPQ